MLLFPMALCRNPCYRSDWLGVKNALLHHLEPAGSAVGNPISDMAGLVIGGGGAARAAVYALASLKCTPIYLVGRDASELSALVVQYPDFPCIPISDPTRAINVNIAVGCIPAIPPVTPEEIAADACVRAIFSSPSPTPCRSEEHKRVFLDMCYKPRTTPLMLHAASTGWTVISGIEAMLEQGFAQARMWLAKSVDPRHSVGLIPRDVEKDARAFIIMMPDIVVSSHEDSQSTPRRDEGRGSRAIL
jgi:quinate dehydrogenase